MQVARFRSGYATADLGRIEVQRSLVSAAHPPVGLAEGRACTCRRP